MRCSGHLLLALSVAKGSLGCSLAAAPLYGHEITSGTATRKADEGQTWGFAMRGLVHPQQTDHVLPRPAVFGLESEFSSTLQAKCCRSRITPMIGVSTLPLTGSRLGWELLGGWLLGQTSVGNDHPFSTGPTLRGAMPIRVASWPTWPCDKRPYASVGWFLTPEIGLQAVIPVVGNDHAVRTEALGLLWLRAVGWTGLPVF